MVSHVLRHEPWLHESELHGAGWVGINDLMAAIRLFRSGWSEVDRRSLERMVAESAKRRHEIGGDRIRALYG